MTATSNYLPTEIDLTNLPSAWTNIGDRGLKVTPGLTTELMVGISGQGFDKIAITADLDGTVTCTEGYAATVEDGWVVKLTGPEDRDGRA